MTYEYSVYGVTLASDAPLPLPRSAGSGAATVRLTTAPPEFFEREAGAARANPHWDSWFQYAALPGGRSYVRGWEMGETLVAADGRQIFCRPDAAAPPESFQVYLLGQALSFAFLKLGFEPLHGTAVVVEGRAVVFLGGSGLGKSTLAAAFVEAGYPVLTDDVLMTQPVAGQMTAFPGPPRLKLFPKMARRFVKDLARAVRMNTGTPKLVIPLAPAQTCRKPTPIAAFYELASAPGTPAIDSIRIDEMTRRDGALALIAASFNQRLVTRERLVRQFSAATILADRIPVRRLSYPRRLVRLPGVVAAICANAGAPATFVR
jgi:hypothetical protein